MKASVQSADDGGVRRFDWSRTTTYGVPGSGTSTELESSFSFSKITDYRTTGTGTTVVFTVVLSVLCTLYYSAIRTRTSV